MTDSTIDHTTRGAITDRIRLMRPSHWMKNIFIFAPLVFAQMLTDAASVKAAMLVFAAFCLLSSCVYVLNDVTDREADANHPRKRARPVASGRVSVQSALILAALLFTASCAILLFVPWMAALCVVLYLMLNLAYSLGMKHVVLIDIFIIAAGFMLRVLAGARAIDVVVSEWIIVCTLFLSLFLAIAKRRSEINHTGRGETRRVLDDYTPDLVNLIMNVSVAGTIMSYTLYTVSDHVHRYFQTNKFVYTVPIVLFGIFRYLYLDEKRKTAENPVQVFARDPSLILTGAIWVVAVTVIIYWWR